MRVSVSGWGATRARICLFGLLFGLAPFAPSSKADERAIPVVARGEQQALGRELFLREWLPNDPRAHGGDGLGPVFNDSSCVACHNQGGPGGGGSASKNVDLISAVPTEDNPRDAKARRQAESAENAAEHRFVWNVVRAVLGMPIIPDEAQRPARAALDKAAIEELAKFHPGFRQARSIVLQRSGTSGQFQQWHPVESAVRSLFASNTDGPQPNNSGRARKASRNGQPTKISRMLESVTEPLLRFISLARSKLNPNLFGVGEGEFGLLPEAALTRGFGAAAPRGLVFQSMLTSGLVGRDAPAALSLAASQRNPTALFGAGLIDSIPDSAIEEAASVRHRGFPTVRGRVHRLPDGKIGRFGWKSQIASLRDFTLTACAVELGLNVPGHEQAVVPYKPDYRSPGLDMNEVECDALVAFLAGLPAPRRASSAGPEHAALIGAGERLFTETGCAACHLPKLGNVEGIYSDLLLHRMGPALSDGAIYGQQLPETDEEDSAAAVLAGGSPTEANDRTAAATDSSAFKRSRRAPRRSEWRTPPLWGLRDSSPYLHDGRAETIEQAIAMHGGEALASTNRFFKLPHEKRQQLVSFLKSLTAPELSAASAAAAK